MITVTLQLAESLCRSHGLRQAVEARAGRRVRDLRVEWVGETGVVLHGHTDSYHVKQIAQHVVGRVSGRAVLANRIEVGQSACRSATVWPAAAFSPADRPVPAVSA